VQRCEPTDRNRIEGSVCGRVGIPNVLDRVIQEAIAQILGPIFDPGFSASSFGFRPHCSAHGAMRQVQAFVKAGFRIAVDLDLAKFFDNVNARANRGLNSGPKPAV
jgi:retron-type reverse transcriptase